MNKCLHCQINEFLKTVPGEFSLEDVIIAMAQVSADLVATTAPSHQAEVFETWVGVTASFALDVQGGVWKTAAGSFPVAERPQAMN